MLPWFLKKKFERCLKAETILLMLKWLMNLFMLHSFQSWDNQYPKGSKQECFIIMQYYRLWILTKRTEPHQEVSQTIPSVTSFLITSSSVTMVKNVIIISQEVKAL